MQMIDCPHCGAANSEKREYCYRCGGELRGVPSKASEVDYMPTCGNCLHAAIFPPAGHRIGPEEVWCAEKGVPVSSSQMAGDCFEEAFSWKREDILD